MADEIAKQPAAWLQAAAGSAGHAQLLPHAGERVAVVGCGTSWFVAEAYAALRESGGHGETDCFTASLFPSRRHYDRLVTITRSGTTTEIIRLLEAGVSCPTVAITAAAHTPVTALAESAVILDYADERSVVQTLFATTTIALLRAHLGEDLAPIAQAARGALLEPLPEDLLQADQFTFLGEGWAHGLAREAALKMREAAQVWTESYPAMEYRHGPIAIAETGRVVWILGEAAAGLEEDALATGATVICNHSDPLVDLVRVQRLALAKAELLGLDVDHPRNLTRSVVLTG